MKTTKTILALMAAIPLGLTACSQSDDVEKPAGDSAGKEIRFTADTEFTRAGDYTTNNLKQFYVYAYTGTGTSPSLFMDNVTVTKTASNTWTYSPVSYWPAGEDVDFYAYAPADWVGSTSPLKPILYENYYNDTDLIYAVSPNLRGNQGVPNAQVVFHFRHALSKINVKLSSSNTRLRVQVSNVVVAGLNCRGNFHFPGTATTGTPTAETIGTWTDQNTTSVIPFHMAQTEKEVFDLTSTPTDMSTTGLGGPKYVIPQPLVWANGGGDGDMYIAVMASVYDASTGDKLWPNANTPEENVVPGSTFGDGVLKFPLRMSNYSEFSPGVSYTYNLTINNNSDMGAIEFGTPSIDSYIEVNSKYE